jgi:uncharacterized protein (TIGR02145 family)
LLSKFNKMKIILKMTVIGIITISVFVFVSCTKEKVNLPVVITMAPEEALTTTAMLPGKITNNGGGTISASGVCWSTSQNPDLNDNFTTDIVQSGMFTSNVTGLTSNTVYFYRAYATNEAGTSFGKEYYLVTSFGTVTDFEGNSYNTVKIGSQIWMRENLRATKYSDGTDIPSVFSPSTEARLGKLYTWQAAMKNSSQSSATPSGVQGACPAGWHLPSNDEFGQLEYFLGVPSAQLSILGQYRGDDHAKLIKDADPALWGSTLPAINSTGFSALPTGIWYNGSLLQIGEDGKIAAWWTTSVNITGGGQTISHTIGSSNNWFWVSGSISPSPGNGLSLRCIKD